MQFKLENLALKTVAEQIPEAVVLADAKGRITWANRAFEILCGYSSSEFVGKNPGRLLQGEETNPKTVREFSTAVGEGLQVQADILNYHKDGHSYWARVSLTPLRDAVGSLEGFIAIERDVTEEHQTLDELHGEVVELYTIVLREELAQDRRLRPDDPFLRSISA